LREAEEGGPCHTALPVVGRAWAAVLHPPQWLHKLLLGVKGRLLGGRVVRVVGVALGPVALSYLS